MGDTGEILEAEPGHVDGEAAEPSGRRNWLWLFAAGAAVLAIGLILGGVYLGWRAAAHEAQPTPSTSVVTIAADPYAGAADTVEMPDVRGLTRADALTALSDAGIPSRVVTIADVPWAGVTGVVVGQAPLFGTSNPTEITLRVAGPAKVPSVLGTQEDAAMTALESLGARVEVTRVYRPGEAAGTVLSVSPASGRPVPDVVKLVTAANADAVFLDQVPTINGYCNTGSATVNGTDYPHSVNCGSGPVDNPSVVAYSLRRGVQTVTGTAGIDDSADPASSATVTVLLDGKVRQTLRFAYGKPAKVGLATAGALRLELRIVSNTEASVVLADVQLLGDPAIIARLGATS